MKKIIVLCTAIALGPVAAIHAQRGEPGSERVAVTKALPLVTKLLPLEAKVVPGQPYSAEIATESIQTLADGNRIVQRTTGRVFRDSQGRVRREEDRRSGGPAISIMDPIAGVSISLDPATRTARQTSNGPSIEIAKVVKELQLMKSDVELRMKKLDAAQATAAAAGAQEADRLKAEADRLKAAQEADRRRKVEAKLEEFAGGRGVAVRREPGNKLDEQSEERLQDRLIEGVLASGVRRTTTIPSGAIGNEQPIKIVSEEWTSPDLQILVLTDRTDPRMGHSTYRLLKIVRSDPDPALFQVPADYTLQQIPGLTGRGAGGVIERPR
jgi:hypothetical protein